MNIVPFILITAIAGAFLVIGLVSEHQSNLQFALIASAFILAVVLTILGIKD